MRDFPGGPGVKTPCFQRREHSFDIWSGKFCMLCMHKKGRGRGGGRAKLETKQVVWQWQWVFVFWVFCFCFNCIGSSLQSSAHRLSCPEAWGTLVHQPEIEPMSPPLEGRFLTTGPPGKSQQWIFFPQWCKRTIKRITFHFVVPWCLMYDYAPSSITGGPSSEVGAHTVGD